MSDAACLAPPGTGLYANGVPEEVAALAGITNASQPTTLPCPIGYYKSGWNLEECQPCGFSVLTIAARSDSSDAWYSVPKNLALNSAAYSALVSPMVFTSSANCSNLPGYGWEHGVATECPVGAAAHWRHTMASDYCDMLRHTNHTPAAIPLQQYPSFDALLSGGCRCMCITCCCSSAVVL